MTMQLFIWTCFLSIGIPSRNEVLLEHYRAVFHRMLTYLVIDGKYKEGNDELRPIDKIHFKKATCDSIRQTPELTECLLCYGLVIELDNDEILIYNNVI